MPSASHRSRFGPLMTRQFSSLGVYNYRLYFFGQIVSVTGTWMQNTGMAWLVLQKSDSALALGSVSTVDRPRKPVPPGGRELVC